MSGIDPELKELLDARLDKLWKEGEVKDLRRAPVKAMFEAALKAQGDELESLKVQLAEHLVCDVWNVASTGVHSCGDSARRALAIEITGTRYARDGNHHEYHADTLSISTYPGHCITTWYGGIPLAMQCGADDLMPDYKGPRLPQDDAGFKLLADAYEASIAALSDE